MNKSTTSLIVALLIAAFLNFALPVHLPIIPSHDRSLGSSSDTIKALNPRQDSITMVTNIQLSPSRVAQLFTVRAPSKEKETNPQIQVVNTPESAVWLKRLGTIRDSAGIERYYFKDTRNDTVLKVRTDGTNEKGYQLLQNKTGNYLIVTPDGTFTLTGDKL